MVQRERILVSACLLGETCRYDGKSQPCEAVRELARSFDLIPVCPEQLGGLPTPRTPSEIQPDGRVIDKRHIDRTDAFNTGAQAAVSVAREHSCRRAVLKANSPSCGVRHVYDGSFTGILIAGQGITAAALIEAGVAVFDERDIEHAAGFPD